MAAAAPRPGRDRLRHRAVGGRERAGDELIERHDETTTGAGDAHEELYLVLDGRATFTVDGEEIDAPAGTCVLVEVGTMREAVAAEPARACSPSAAEPGAALPASPFEHYYAAQPAYDAGDFDRAVEIASAGLADWPDHPLIHYQLACYHARAGRLDDARRSPRHRLRRRRAHARLGGRGRGPRRAAVGGGAGGRPLRACGAAPRLLHHRGEGVRRGVRPRPPGAIEVDWCCRTTLIDHRGHFWGQEPHKRPSFGRLPRGGRPRPVALPRGRSPSVML